MSFVIVRNTKKKMWIKIFLPYKGRAPGKLTSCDDDLSAFCPPLETSCPPAENVNESHKIELPTGLKNMHSYSLLYIFCYEDQSSDWVA